MAGTFTPHPGSAPLARQVLAQAAMESRLMLRNGEQLLLAVVIPLIVLVGGVVAGRQVGLSFARPLVDVLTPGVFALAVMSTSFTSLAIATGFERRYGVIKRLGSSPLPRYGLLLGKVGALLLVQALQVVLIGVLAATLGWNPANGWLPALITIAFGTAAFASLGLLVAGVLRAEATLAAANLIYLLLLVGGGAVLPTSSYGQAQGWVQLLPSGALGDGLRAAFLDGSMDWPALLVLAGWTMIGSIAAGRWFKWE